MRRRRGIKIVSSGCEAGGGKKATITQSENRVGTRPAAVFVNWHRLSWHGPDWHGPVVARAVVSAMNRLNPDMMLNRFARLQQGTRNSALCIDGSSHRGGECKKLSESGEHLSRMLPAAQQPSIAQRAKGCSSLRFGSRPPILLQRSSHFEVPRRFPHGA